MAKSKSIKNMDADGLILIKALTEIDIKYTQKYLDDINAEIKARGLENHKIKFTPEQNKIAREAVDMIEDSHKKK